MYGITNMNPETGIHFGAISLNSLSGDSVGEAESIYPEEVEIDCENESCRTSFNVPLSSSGESVTCPQCRHTWELSPYEFDCIEPIGLDLTANDSDYTTEYSESLNCFFVTKSPFYTFARACSPCAPNAGDLDSPCDSGNGLKTYCLGYDFFDEYSPCPYVCYMVKDESRVDPPTYPEWN